MIRGEPAMLPVLPSTLESENRRHQFTVFYETYNLLLFRYALSILAQPALAEEALQESWVRCVLHADTFWALPDAARFPWMRVVVKNICLNLLKQEHKTLSLDPDWDGPAPEPGDTLGIVSIIRSMPEQYRTILELKFVLEWADKEIAQFVGLSPDAVRTRISRGRKLLQDALIQEGYTYDV